MATAELERYADYLESLARHPHELHPSDHDKLKAIAAYIRGKTNVRMKSAPPLTDDNELINPTEQDND